MKTIRILLPALCMMLAGTSLYGQRGHGYGHPHGGYGHRPHGYYGGGKVVVVKRSPFRPKKVIVYHPVWAPALSIHRRWVFFPRYNFYWDNWRGVYVFRSGAVWVAQPSPPPVIVNVNLQNEKHYELKENNDDTDDIYKSNEEHAKEYKPE